MGGVLFVFDKSGSMSWGLNGSDQALPGQRRIDHAKAALRNQLGRLPDQTATGLILFPYSMPCDTAIVAYIGVGQKEGLTHAINAVDVPWIPYVPYVPGAAVGGTPLADAINVAGQVAQQYGRGVTVVVLTDGEETCGGNPAAVAQFWRNRGIDIRINVVGFVVNPTAQQQLSAIANMGGGRYYDARSADQLNIAVGQAVQPVPLPAYRQPARPAGDAICGFFNFVRMVFGLGVFVAGLAAALAFGWWVGSIGMGMWPALPFRLPEVAYALIFHVGFPAAAFVIYMLYIGPPIWNWVTGRGIPFWTYRARQTARTLVLISLIVIGILMGLLCVLAALS